jgi:hypothetical protein
VTILVRHIQLLPLRVIVSLLVVGRMSGVRFRLTTTAYDE